MLAAELPTGEAPPPTPESPARPVAVAICTRDRGDLVLRPIRALLAGTFHEFEIIVVDQSSSSETREALGEVDDCRVRYTPTTTRGLSAARNIALRANRAPLLAFTDDDCEPSPDWLLQLVAAAASVSGPAMFFGPLVAESSIGHAGMVPAWRPRSPGRKSRPWLEYCMGGFGGNMALNSEAIAAVRGFSTRLGRGAALTACEEGELAFRLSLLGGTIHELEKPAVVHHGVVEWAAVRASLRSDFSATGHVLGWYLRRSTVAAATQLAYCLGRELCLVLTNIARMRRPFGVRRAHWLMRGVCAGLRDSSPLVAVDHNPAGMR